MGRGAERLSTDANLARQTVSRPKRSNSGRGTSNHVQRAREGKPIEIYDTTWTKLLMDDRDSKIEKFNFIWSRPIPLPVVEGGRGAPYKPQCTHKGVALNDSTQHFMDELEDILCKRAQAQGQV